MSTPTAGCLLARRAVHLLLLAVGVAACDVSPPSGAFDPINFDQPIASEPDVDGGVTVEASVPVFPGGGAGGATPGAAGMAGGQAGMAGGQAGMAGGEAGGQAGIGGTEGGAGGTVGGPEDPNLARLQKLAGYYYMRMDMRSTVSANSFLGPVRTRNRVSHLLVTQLGVGEDGRLVGLEQLCHQTFQIECDAGCSEPSSVLRPEVRNELINVRPTRNYQVSATGATLRLVGEPQTMYLGFDATNDTTLPSNTSDMRVWLNGGGAREGMWLYLETRSASGFAEVKCDVYTVQKFVSTFEGALQGSLDEPSFMNATATLNSGGSEGKTIGTTNSNCADDPNNPGTSASVAETVRFAPASVAVGQEAAFWSCPDVSAWDGPMPPPDP